MKELVGLHGPLGVNVDATMWHDYLGAFCVLTYPSYIVLCFNVV